MLLKNNKDEILRNNILKLAIDEVSRIANECNVRILKDCKNLAEKMVARGSFACGAHHSLIDDLLRKEAESFIKQSIDSLYTLQKELNIKLSPLELEKIEPQIQTRYISLVNNHNYLHTQIDERYSSVTSETSYNSLIQNASIKKKIEELKIKNKETKDTPEVTYTIRQYYLNIAGFVISVIAIAVALLKK